MLILLSVVIVLHNDPDPDALASGLALRNVLRRTKTTAVLAALQGVTRPENQRMMNLLDIQVEILTPEQVVGFDRIAMVDVQPHYFGGAIDRVKLNEFDRQMGALVGFAKGVLLCIAITFFAVTSWAPPLSVMPR